MIVRKMEDKDTKKRGIKTLIIILSVLLAVSIAALAGILIYRSVTRNQPATVTVPDNIITPDAESNTPEAGSNDRTEESVPENSTDMSSENTSSDTSTYETDSSADTGVQVTEMQRSLLTTLLRLQTLKRSEQSTQKQQTMNTLS